MSRGRPRLLVLTNLYPLEGSPSGGVFVAHRVQAMRRAGAEVDLLALRLVRSRPLEMVARIAGKPERRLADPTGVFRDLPVPLSALQLVRGLRDHYSESAVAMAARLVESEVDVASYDAIIAHGMYLLPAGAVAAALSEKWHVPFSVVLHGSDVNLTMPRRAAVYVDVLNRADLAIFVSDALRQRAKALGFTGGHAVVLPNGVDTRVFSPPPTGARRGATVAYIGNLLRIKGADRLPALFRAISASLPDARFVVVGDGPEQDSIARQTTELPVRFTGRLSQPEVATVMREVDVLVLPSRSEGWPCVILEAYACDLPVVATDVGGISEAVIDPGALVHEGGDVPGRLAERVVEVLTGSVARKDLRGRAEGYSWDRLARRELSLMEQVVNEKRRKHDRAY